MLRLFRQFFNQISHKRIQDTTNLVDTFETFLGIALVLDIVNHEDAVFQRLNVFIRDTVIHRNVIFGVQQNLVEHRFKRRAFFLEHFAKANALRNLYFVQSCQLSGCQAPIHFLNFTFDKPVLQGVFNAVCNRNEWLAEFRIFQSFCQFCSIFFRCTVRDFRPPDTLAQMLSPVF